MARGEARVAAVLVCGGNSRRMGRPKEWLLLEGSPLLCVLAGRLASRVDLLVTVARPGQLLPEPELDIPLLDVRDSVPDQGPLRGLADGLAALPSSVERTFVCACDVPLLQQAAIDLLLGELAARPEADGVVPLVAGRLHPLVASYRPRVRDVAQSLLERGQRRLSALAEHAQIDCLEEGRLRAADPDLRSLRNANTPEEFRALLASTS